MASIDASKKGPGRPKKPANTSAATLEDVNNLRRSLADVEAHLSAQTTAQISETVSLSIVPLKSLIASLQTVLHNKIETLESELRKLQSNIDSIVKTEVDEALKKALHDRCSTAAAINAAPQPAAISENLPTPTSNPIRSTNDRDQDRKFNIVVFGIPENPKGTHWTTRALRDLNSAASTLSNIENTISSHSIRDCYRLGKFSESSKRPRPLLIKLSRSHDVTTILSKRSSLKGSDIVIKPDMSPTEKTTNAILLKQRWSLINSSVTNSQSIRIRGSRLLINGRVHGQVIDAQYLTSPLLSDHVIPRLPSVSDPINTSPVTAGAGATSDTDLTSDLTSHTPVTQINSNFNSPTNSD